MTKKETRDLYRKRAARYDLALWVYRLAGFRVGRYRELAVEGLALKPGDSVVDLGCGTGANFALLEAAVGPGGRIIGVDLTDAMLQEAASRVATAGWGNVELLQSDLAEVELPAGVAGALSTFAIMLVPEYDEVIARTAARLNQGGRIAICDFKEPDWPSWLVSFAAWLNKPYGVSLDLAERHPWESVRRHTREVLFRELYFGALFLSIGESRAAGL